MKTIKKTTNNDDKSEALQNKPAAQSSFFKVRSDVKVGALNFSDFSINNLSDSLSSLSDSVKEGISNLP